MERVISGKLEYLKMVKGSGNPLYIRLKERYNVLEGKGTSKKVPEVQNTPEKSPIENSKEKIQKDITIPVNHSPGELIALLKNLFLPLLISPYSSSSLESRCVLSAKDKRTGPGSIYGMCVC